MSENRAPLPDFQANDEEIHRYAGLLDTLGIGLLVQDIDGTTILRNEQSTATLGASQPIWLDDHGQTLRDQDLPFAQALRTRQPVFGISLCLDREGKKPIWFEINAVPVFTPEGNVRRILLTYNDITRLKELQLEIARLSTIDTLTGVQNQHTITELLKIEIRRAQRYGTPFSLAQVSIDLFLPLCEKHGQETAQQLLSELSRLFRRELRELDMIGRIGQENFLLILPNVRLNDAIIGAERIRARVEAETFTDRAISITISGGITEYAGENAAVLIERSTSLLEHARTTGRNRLCLDSEVF